MIRFTLYGIIEDDLDIQVFVARVLELEGYRVLAAETADEGLRLLKENQVALLLDLRLPGDSGWVSRFQQHGSVNVS